MLVGTRSRSTVKTDERCNPEGPHRIVFADRDILALHETVAAQPVARLVVIRRPVVVDQPRAPTEATLPVDQAPVAIRLPEPEPADAAKVPHLAPEHRIELSPGVEGRVDLVAAVDASTGKIRSAGECQGDVGQRGVLHR